MSTYYIEHNIVCKAQNQQFALRRLFSCLGRGETSSAPRRGPRGSRHRMSCRAKGPRLQSKAEDMLTLIRLIRVTPIAPNSEVPPW